MADEAPGKGDVEIVIAGQTHVLRRSLDACMQLTTHPAGLFGGPGSIYDRISKLDIRVMASVIRLGLGIGASGVKDLEKMMFESGLTTLQAPLYEFIGNIVSNGEAPKDGDQEGADPQTASA